ncbi:hypothetical protein D3C81_1512800 [compost metagenome]
MPIRHRLQSGCAGPGRAEGSLCQSYRQLAAVDRSVCRHLLPDSVYLEHSYHEYQLHLRLAGREQCTWFHFLRYDFVSRILSGDEAYPQEKPDRRMQFLCYSAKGRDRYGHFGRGDGSLGAVLFQNPLLCR